MKLDSGGRCDLQNLYDDDREVLKTKLLRSGIWLSRSSLLLKTLSDAQLSSYTTWEENSSLQSILIQLFKIQNNLHIKLGDQNIHKHITPQRH